MPPVKCFAAAVRRLGSNSARTKADYGACKYCLLPSWSNVRAWLTDSRRDMTIPARLWSKVRQSAALDTTKRAAHKTIVCGLPRSRGQRCRCCRSMVARRCRLPTASPQQQPGLTIRMAQLRAWRARAGDDSGDPRAWSLSLTAIPRLRLVVLSHCTQARFTVLL